MVSFKKYIQTWRILGNTDICSMYIPIYIGLASYKKKLYWRAYNFMS